MIDITGSQRQLTSDKAVVMGFLITKQFPVVVHIGMRYNKGPDVVIDQPVVIVVVFAIMEEEGIETADAL